MITWLKIIFIILFIFVWFSTVGIAISEYLKIDVKKYYFPIGLIAIFGIYEIVMYYPLMYHLNIIYSAVTIYLLMALSFIFGLLNINKIIKELLSKQTIFIFVVTIISFLILFFLNPMLDLKNDIEFYLSLIRSSNELETLGQYNPYQIGSYQLLGGNHLLYGFYYFVAYLSKIVRLDPYIFAVWDNQLMYYTFAMSTYMLIVEKLIKNKTIKICAVVFIFVSVFCVSEINIGIYGNIYKTVMFSLMYLFLNDYKESYIKKTITLFVISAATLSVHQSAVFLLVGVIVSYFIYCAFNNDEELPYIFIWAIPTVLNGLYIYGVHVQLLSFVYILLAIVVPMFWKKFKNFFVIISKIISIITPFLLVAVSMYIEFYGNPITNIKGYFDIVFKIDITLLGETISKLTYYVCLLYLVAYILISIKKREKTFYFVLVITGIFLYCPLTVSFVSTYMAKGVYDRMSGLIFIPMFIIVFLTDCNSEKLLKSFLYLEIALFIICSLCSKNTIIDNAYDHLYRTEKDLLKVTRDVDEFAIKNPIQNKNVFSTNLTAHSYTENLIYKYSLSNFREVYYYDRSPSNQLIQSIYDLSTKSKYFGDDYNSGLVYRFLYTIACPYFIVGTDQRKELYEDLDNKCQRISSTGKYIGYYCEFDYLSNLSK